MRDQWYVDALTTWADVLDRQVERHGEEAGIEQWWLPFEDAVEAVLSGAISDALSVAAVLAERTRRARS